MEKPGIEPATPGLQDIGLSLTPRRLHRALKKLCVAFPWVETSTGPVGFMICVYYMMVVLWRSRESNLRPLVYKA